MKITYIFLISIVIDISIAVYGSCQDACDDPYSWFNSCNCDGECGDRDDCCNDYESLCVQSCISAGGYPNLIGNGYCTRRNNNAECNYDGGDCCGSSCVSNGHDCGIAGYECKSPDIVGTVMSHSTIDVDIIPSIASLNLWNPTDLNSGFVSCVLDPVGNFVSKLTDLLLGSINTPAVTLDVFYKDMKALTNKLPFGLGDYAYDLIISEFDQLESKDMTKATVNTILEKIATSIIKKITFRPSKIIFGFVWCAFSEIPSLQSNALYEGMVQISPDSTNYYTLCYDDNNKPYQGFVDTLCKQLGFNGGDIGYSNTPYTYDNYIYLLDGSGLDVQSNKGIKLNADCVNEDDLSNCTVNHMEFATCSYGVYVYCNQQSYKIIASSTTTTTTTSPTTTTTTPSSTTTTTTPSPTTTIITRNVTTTTTINTTNTTTSSNGGKNMRAQAASIYKKLNFFLLLMPLGLLLQN